jgi:predicted DNA-binding protein YlxM (UPF0122 family)
MRFKDVIAEFDNPDKYILYLLDLGFTPTEISSRLGVSRQHIYNVIKRTKPALRKLDIRIENEAW